MNKTLSYKISSLKINTINMHYILLVVLIFACVRPIDFMFDVFSIPVPMGSLATGAPYMLFFCIAIYIANLQILFQFSKPVFDPSFFYIGFILVVWAVVECLHGFISGDLSRNLLQSFFWFGLFHQMLRSHLQISAHLDIDQTELLKKASLFIVLGLAIVHLLLCMLFVSNMFGGYINEDQLFNRNSLSFLSLLGVFLVLYYPLNKDSFFNRIVNLFALGIFSLIPVVNKTRGAIIIFTVLISIKIFSILWKNSKGLFGCAIIIIIVAAGILYPRIIKKNIEKFSFGLNPEINYTYNQLLQLPGPEASIYIRNRTNLLVFHAFLKNPVLGTGMAKVKKELQVGGWWCHTFYLLPLAAYGLIGFSPFFFFFFSEIYQNWKRCFWTTMAFGAFLLGTWTFTNDLYIWFSIPLNIFWLERKINSTFLT
jgi:hypothetical protein